MTTSILYSLLAARFGASAALPAYLVFVTGLVGLSMADLERRLLPISLLYPTLIATALLLTVASITQHRLSSLLVAAIWGLVVTGAMWLVWRTGLRDEDGLRVRRLASNGNYHERFGFGDVRLAGLVAFGVAWVVPPKQAMLAAALAFLAGGICFGIVFAVRTTITGGWRDRLPLGPFLAAGAVWTLVWGSLALTTGSRI